MQKHELTKARSEPLFENFFEDKYELNRLWVSLSFKDSGIMDSWKLAGNKSQSHYSYSI